MKQPQKGHKKHKGHVPVKTGGTKPPGPKVGRGGGGAGGGFVVPGPKVGRGTVATQSAVPGPKVKRGAGHKGHLKVPGPKVKRGAPAAAAVSFCAADALAASLRLSGWPCGDVDVLALYQVTAGHPDAGASILETLLAASDHGLAGLRPASFAPVDLDDPSAVLLGVDLPGAHTVCVDGGSWWSWGVPWHPAMFPQAAVEEAWSVTWPSWD